MHATITAAFFTPIREKMLRVKNNRDKVIDHFPISSRKLKIGSVTKQPQMVGWLVGLHLFISFEKIAPVFFFFCQSFSIFWLLGRVEKHSTHLPRVRILTVLGFHKASHYAQLFGYCLIISSKSVTAL